MWFLLFVIDIPEEEARYWTYKLEQINALEADTEVGIVFVFVFSNIKRWGKSLYRTFYGLSRD